MNPTYHPEAQGLAFNVKRYSRVADDRGTPWQRDSAYERAQQLWWADAKRAAIYHGFDDIGACGRSGGWAFPIPAVDPSDARTDPDGFAETLARVEALGDDIAEMMREVDERFTAALDEVMAEDFAEGERLSVCEARLAERMRTERTLLAAVREYVRAGHDVPTYRAIEAALIAYDEARA